MHSLNNLQSRELLTLLLLQGVGNVLRQRLVAGNGDILQSVGTLLGLLDIGRQLVGWILYRRQLDGQILYLCKRDPGDIQRFLRAVEGIGRPSDIRSGLRFARCPLWWIRCVIAFTILNTTSSLSPSVSGYDHIAVSYTHLGIFWSLSMMLLSWSIPLTSIVRIIFALPFLR